MKEFDAVRREIFGLREKRAVLLAQLQPLEAQLREIDQHLKRLAPVHAKLERIVVHGEEFWGRVKPCPGKHVPADVTTNRLSSSEVIFQCLSCGYTAGGSSRELAIETWNRGGE